MGVVFESTLLVLLAILLAAAAVYGIGRALWKPLLSRVWRYFVAWWERDARAEREAWRQAECRRRAEGEVKELLGEAEESASVATAHEEKPVPQRVKR